MLKNLLDKLMDVLVEDTDAGACVPNAGDCCRKGTHTMVSCTGPCVPASPCP
ncbi:hypothetical protein [Pimelobacter simplex]|uniref:hypothetical protein n=1 Tax=Nocardioides simplex TaxID=2045 RepID=UPI003AAD4236